MTEPFPPNSSGSAEKWVLRNDPAGDEPEIQVPHDPEEDQYPSRKLEEACKAAGGVGSLGFALGSGFRIAGTRVGLEDLVNVQDSSLQVVGEEIRSANGYTVRKLENGIAYQEGEHILTIRQSAPHSPSPDDPATVQETSTTKTVGTLSHSTTVTVKVATKGAVCWNPPYKDEPIPPERLAEIMKRIAQALAFYESKAAGRNRS